MKKHLIQKKILGNVETPSLVFKLIDEENSNDLNKIIWACRDKKVDYYLQHNCFTLTQEALYQLLPSKYFEEIRAWKGKDKIFICSKMDHQRLSNCVGLLVLMLKKGIISKKNSENYLKNLHESIVPELNERFNGEILEYIPYYEWEKEMVKLPDVVSCENI